MSGLSREDLNTYKQNKHHIHKNVQLIGLSYKSEAAVTIFTRPSTYGTQIRIMESESCK